MPKFHMTVGGKNGYYFRRIFHIAMLTILSWLYFFVFVPSSHFNQQDARVAFSIISGLLILGEALRLYFKRLFFGMREYERHTISSVFWTNIALMLVFSFVSSAPIGLGIVWCTAFVDPLVGELRHRSANIFIAISTGLFLAISLWLSLAFIYNLSWQGVTILAIAAVLGERIKLKWLDDNAIMLLVPLIISFQLHF